ncbi:MAG: response regulator [Opitutaceae bacterium]
MKKIYILCVDDELEVLQAVEQNIAELEDTFPILTAESSAEARTLVKQIADEGNLLGLVLCDHVMPGDNGVDFLIELDKEDGFANTRKVLVTGQAGLDATVKAVNQGRLNHYIAKPWQAENLLAIAKDQLTRFVIRSKLSPLPYMMSLDTEKLSEYIRTEGITTDQ